MNGLYWNRIALGAILPAFVALLLAYPFWRKQQGTFGSIVGAAIIFGTALALMFVEYNEIDRATKACLDAGKTCWPEPSAFVRFAVYAGVGLAEVIALFFVSIKVDERIRSRDYAPEWRR